MATAPLQAEDYLPQPLTVALVLVNLVLAVLLGAALTLLTLDAPLLPAPIGPTVGQASPSSAASATVTSSGLPAREPRQALFDTLLTMLVAGATGGTLCNLRGLFRWMSDNKGKFPKAFGLPFVIRPFTGALTGLFVFFVGNLLVAALAEARPRSWESLEGRLPYIGFALLAGFAAQEFMQRLKEVAKTVFGSKDESAEKAP